MMGNVLFVEEKAIINFFVFDKLITKLRRKPKSNPRFSIEGDKVRALGIPEIESLGRPGHMIGEGMATFGSPRGPLYIVNTETKKYKKLVDANGGVVGFTKDDIDYKSLEGVEHSGCAYSMVSRYAGIGRWDNFHNGICALGWTLYPDGRYFADEDGYGMEDNDEVEIYCVIDKNFKVLKPFQYGKSALTLLNEVKRE